MLVTYNKLFQYSTYKSIRTLRQHKKKLTKDSHQAIFCKRLMYLLCLHYRSTNQLQNKFQHGNNVIEAKQLLNFYMMEKRDLLFVFVGRGVTQSRSSPIYLYLHLSIYLSIYLSVYLSIYIYIYYILKIYIIDIYLYISVCVCVCVLIYIYTYMCI